MKEFVGTQIGPRPNCPKVPTNYFGKGENYILKIDEQVWFATEMDKWEKKHPDDPEGKEAINQWRQDVVDWKAKKAHIVSIASQEPRKENLLVLKGIEEEKIKGKLKVEQERARLEHSIIRARFRARHNSIPIKVMVRLIRMARKDGCTVERLLTVMMDQRQAKKESKYDYV